MALIWIDQTQAQSDADVLLPYLQNSVANAGFFVPQEIKEIAARWIPIVQMLADCDTVREDIVSWLNARTGAQPPT